MSPNEKGTLTVKTIKSDIEKIADYLSTLYKNTDRQNLLSLLQKPPIVLGKNVPIDAAKKVIADLEKIGATAVYTPNASETSKDPAQAKIELRHIILSAFKGRIAKPAVPLSYKLGLMTVSLSMIFLVLIYLSIIIGVAYFTYWHATHNITILQRALIRKLAIAEYIAPIIIGCLMLFFMIKPIFVRHVSEFRSFRVTRREEPLLFAFTDKLSQMVGAPAPSEIHLDMDVNASARFKSGFTGFYNKELVLTIGLPLIAGLNLNQMAGVLAHEFGHFSQSAGMGLTFIIRSINFWFERVVFEKDEWDERIKEWAQNDKDYGLAIIVSLAQLFIFITRRILWCLMMIGHSVSCFMLRQMEYNADQYEIALAGSLDFESTSRRLTVLSMAHQQALYNLRNSWDEGRLADNLPAFIIASEKQIPDDLKNKILKNNLSIADSGFFDTHPTDRERIAAAKRINSPSLFRVDTGQSVIKEYIERVSEAGNPIYAGSPPASILFNNFDSYSRKATLDFYQDSIGDNFTGDALIGVDNLAKKQDIETEYSNALNRYYLGQFNYMCSPGMPEKLTSLTDPQKTAADIKTSREKMIRAAKSHVETLKRLETYQERSFATGQARILLEAGFRFDPRQFNLRSCDREALEQAEQRNQQWKQTLDKELETFQEHLRTRLTGSLQLLTISSVSSRLADINPLITNVHAFLKATRVIEKRLYQVDMLKLGYIQLSILASQLDGEEVHPDLQNSINGKMDDLRAILRELKDNFNTIGYPFEHAIQNIKLGEFVVEEIPLNNDINAFLRTTFETVNRVIKVHSRLLGRLAFIAERTEESLGLPKLNV